MADLSFLVGLFVGDVEGEGASDSAPESGVTKRFFFGDARTFLGDHCSFQSLTTSWDQNASISGCSGAAGILVGLLLVGELSILCFGGLGGGVDGREDWGARLEGEYRLGGALSALAYVYILVK